MEQINMIEVNQRPVRYEGFTFLEDSTYSKQGYRIFKFSDDVEDEVENVEIIVPERDVKKIKLRVQGDRFAVISYSIYNEPNNLYTKYRFYVYLVCGNIWASRSIKFTVDHIDGQDIRRETRRPLSKREQSIIDKINEVAANKSLIYDYYDINKIISLIPTIYAQSNYINYCLERREAKIWYEKEKEERKQAKLRHDQNREKQEANNKNLDKDEEAWL